MNGILFEKYFYLLIIITISILRKMSLVRNSSKKKFSISPEDLAACLDQKNSMIAVLQAEVEDLRFNHEKYERMQE